MPSKKKKRQSRGQSATPLPNFEQFSPCQVEKATPSPRRGHQLTDIPREVKDSCASWHNCIQEWYKIAIEGTIVLNDICHLKASTGESAPESADFTDSAFTKLQDICTLLNEKYQEMVNQLQIMQKLKEKFERLMELSNHQRQNRSFTASFASDDSHVAEPVFDTWTMDRYCTTSANMLGMFEKQIEVNKVITHNAGSKSQQDVKVMGILWEHQVHIDKQNVDKLLTDMLTESGHCST